MVNELVLIQDQELFPKRHKIFCGIAGKSLFFSNNF